MCQISFSINANDSDGTIVSAECQYKLNTNSVWIDFPTNPIPLASFWNVLSPDLQVDGVYNLQVRVIDNEGAVSDWFAAEDFKIGDCLSVFVPPPGVETLLSFNSNSGSNSCAVFNSGGDKFSFYINTSPFSSATSILTPQNTIPNSGYYSDGNVSRFWDSTIPSFSGNNEICIN